MIIDEKNIEVFSKEKEKELQYLDKISETDLTDYQIRFYKLDEKLKNPENNMYKDTLSEKKPFEETNRKDGEVKIFSDILIELQKKCYIYEELVYNIETTMDRIYPSHVESNDEDPSIEIKPIDFVSGVSSSLYNLNRLNCRLHEINYRLSLLA